MRSFTVLVLLICFVLTEAYFAHNADNFRSMRVKRQWGYFGSPWGMGGWGGWGNGLGGWGGGWNQPGWGWGWGL